MLSELNLTHSCEQCDAEIQDDTDVLKNRDGVDGFLRNLEIKDVAG